MNIEEINLPDYTEPPYNPRKPMMPGDSDFEKLSRSYDEFGSLEPIVVNLRTHHIVGGNQRVRVMKARGITKTKAVIVDFDLNREKAANLALNRIVGSWDEAKLSDLFSDLQGIPDFDVELTGFDAPEISEILDRHAQGKGDDFDFYAAVESIKEPVTQKGDLVELGPHRIQCGDSANLDDLKRVIQDDKIDLIHMDPPYGCKYLAQNRPDLESRPKKSKRWKKLYKDDLSEKEYAEWFRSVLVNVRDFLSSGAAAYIWNGHAKFYFMHQVLKELGFHISTVITWAKPSFAISYADFNQQTEFAIYAFLKNGPHKWYGPTNESNLWTIGRDRVSDLIHPTQKSIEIPSRAIRNSSKRDDIVFDGFLGSGSTLIACENLGRSCRGLEVEPRYVDGIVKRYIATFGKDKVSPKIHERYFREDQNGK